MFSALVCGAVLFRAVRERPRAWGWAGVVLLIAAVGALHLAFEQPAAAYTAFALTLGLVIAPLRLVRRANTHAFREEYARAARFMRWASALHPLDGYRHRVTYLEALELARLDRLDEAFALLRDVPADRPYQRSALATLYGLRGRPEELLAWYDAIPFDERRDDVGLLSFVIRARGETGDLAGMLDDFSLLASDKYRASAAGLPIARLFVHAFLGRLDSLEEMLSGPLSGLPEETRTFWRATALLVRGEQRARDELEALRARSGLRRRAAIGYRLEHALADPSKLDAARLRIVDDDYRIFVEDRRYLHGLAAGAGFRPAATLSLVTLNALYFAASLALGGSTDPEALYRLGAIVTPLFELRESWRAVAALFLHYGPLHLVFNMLGLLALGPFVERALGRARFLAVYLVAGASSMVAVVVFATRDMAVVGASGSVMAIVGAVIVVAARGLRRGASMARRHLVGMAVVCVLQTVVDVLTPQISLTGHAAGLVAGVLLTALLLPRA